MSIIIKGVDIPENFESIAIIAKNETKGEPGCNVVASYYGLKNVIQIPKGHGDIVDKREMVIRRDIIGDRGGITGYYETINNDPNILLESEEE